MKSIMSRMIVLAVLAIACTFPTKAPAASDQIIRYNASAVVSNDLQREVTVGTIYFFADGSGVQTATVTRVVVADETLTTNVADTVTNTITLGSVVYTGSTNLVLNTAFPAGYVLRVSDKASTTNTLIVTRPEL